MAGHGAFPHNRLPGKAKLALAARNACGKSFHRCTEVIDVTWDLTQARNADCLSTILIEEPSRLDRCCALPFVQPSLWSRPRERVLSINCPASGNSQDELAQGMPVFHGPPCTVRLTGYRCRAQSTASSPILISSLSWQLSRLPAMAQSMAPKCASHMHWCKN